MTRHIANSQCTTVAVITPGGRVNRELCGSLRRATRRTFGRCLWVELDAVRWRAQRDVVRDILLSAAECGTWLTLEELRAMTRFPKPSIAAHVRALRTSVGGLFMVGRRRRAVQRIPRAKDADGRHVLAAFEYRVEARHGTHT